MSVSLIIIAHNIRSIYNVGSLLRTCDGLGVAEVYLTGYTPYPSRAKDERLPHLAEKITKQISKTALGAEESVIWEYNQDIHAVMGKLRNNGYAIAGLEQTSNSVPMQDFTPPAKLALVLGSEVTGIDITLIDSLDYCLEIPMYGTKESYNVTCAAAMAMYHILAVNR